MGARMISLSPFDAFVLGNALICFFIFVLAHFAFFRFIKPAEVLKGLMNFFAIGLAFNIGGSLGYLWQIPGSLAGASFFAKCLCMAVSGMVYGVLGFHYVVGIFGPYESSIRLRLVRELYKNYPHGSSLEEILKRYNAQSILKKRLDRLICSKDLALEGSVYKLKNRRNYFTITDGVVAALRKMTEGK